MKLVSMVFCFLVAMRANADIFHLVTKSDLEQRTVDGLLYNPSLKEEGFIHSATLLQLVAAADRHYRDKKNVLVLQISERRLTSPLKYDYVEKQDQYFPHIYGPINLNAVVRVLAMPTNSDGSFRLPDEISSN